MTTLDLPLRSPALYNPHLLSKEELLGLFSARQALLDELLQDLRSAAPGEPAQHHLIVGQRGMGKTMLLRRLRFAVEDDPTLCELWLPLSFPEEQYNVAALSDFWLNCVDALTDALEGRGETNAVAELDRAVEELRTLDEENERAPRAFDLLTRTAAKLAKRLLLLVDNADLVLDRIGEEEWSLREVLSSQPAVTFIGASAAALESAYEYGKAFYDFFRIHELSGLSEEETLAFLLRYADAQGNAEVRDLLEKDPGRLRTLHTLTGGNPRTLVLLFNIFAQGPNEDVRADLERLLDQCTPLYKARFEALAPQAQQVVDSLALHWDPISAGALAEKVRLDVNKVSAQLNRLVREGVVEKVQYEPASKTGFQIAERFFNIWYLMRASRRVRRRLIWLVEFLRMFYGQEELRERVRSHIRVAAELGPDDRLRHAEFSFALALASEDEGIRCVLERSGLQMLVGHGGLRNSLRDLVDLDTAEPDFKSRAEYLERFESLREAFAQLAQDGRIPLDLGLQILRAPVNLALKERIVEAARNQNKDQTKKLEKAFEDFERRFFVIFASSALKIQLLVALQRGQMTTVDDIDGARLVEEATGQKGLVAVAAAARVEFSEDEKALDDLAASLGEAISPYPWCIWLKARGESARSHEVEAAIQRATELAAGHAEAISYLADLMFTSLNRPERAEALYRQAIDLEPGIASTWSKLARVLKDQGRLGEAEEACRRAIDSEPQSPVTWGDLGFVLTHQGRLAEAGEAFQKALEFDPELDPSIWTILGEIRRVEGRLGEAEEALRRALEFDSELEPLIWASLGEVLRLEGRSDEAETALRTAIHDRSDYVRALLSLALLLEDQSRLDEAEEVYRKATAREPRMSESWAALAHLLFLQGRYDEALEGYRKALEIDPSDWYSKHQVSWLLLALNRDLDEAETLARAVVQAEPLSEASQTLACILVRTGSWNQAVAPAMTFLTAWASEVPEGVWPDVVSFFREAVAAGKTREAAELLDELELGERWRPLREALESLARGSRTYLRRVAPEVRKPAEAILEELTAPREGTPAPSRAPDEPDLPAPPVPSRKPTKKSRAKA